MSRTNWLEASRRGESLVKQERSCNESRKDNPWPCKYCGVPDVWYTTEESFDGAYDIYNYHCHACGARWIMVDEID